MSASPAEPERLAVISSMYEAARSFIAGAYIIMSSDGIEDFDGPRTPTLPVTVCAALAVEIGLKTLLVAAGVERPGRGGDGHDLQELVRLVPEDIWNDFLEHQKNTVAIDRTNLDELVADERHTFKTWRYPYEKDADLDTSPSLLLDLARALNFYIEDTWAIERSMNGWLKR